MGDLRSIADEYFRSLNPIAKRICDDVKSTRENYESAWNYLSPDEQNQVINESLIYPAATLQYSLKEQEHEVSSNFFTDLKQSYGRKILEDESGVHWTDEHSSPFSWKTSSQLGINDISSINYATTETKHTNIKKTKASPTPKSGNQNEMPDKSTENSQGFPDYPIKSEDEVDSKISNNSLTNQDHSYSNEVCETRNSQVKQLTRKLHSSNDITLSFFCPKQIPKTGCEFLDNW